MFSFDPDAVELPAGSFIGARYVSCSGDELPIIRPSDGQVSKVFREANESDVDGAVLRTHQAFCRAGWARADPRQRDEGLHRQHWSEHLLAQDKVVRTGIEEDRWLNELDATAAKPPPTSNDLDDEPEEAMQLAAHPHFGLTAGVHTRDISKALNAARGIEAGTIWINSYGRGSDIASPFGGFKQSGFGKDFGVAGYQ